MARDLMRTMSPQPGRLFADSDFFSLSARDSAGYTWKSERIIPQCEWADGLCSFAHAHLRSIKTERVRSEQKHSVSMRYFGTIELPIQFGRADFGNRKMGGHRFSTANSEIAVEEFPDETLFTASSTTALDANFHTRMDEALKFLTAQSVEWRVLERQDGLKAFIELTSASARSTITRMDPPIMRSVHGYWEYGWTLYSKYLEYSLRETDHSFWNHCTSHLHNAREASANALDAWAAGLGVAVEGIAEMIPFQLAEEERSKIESFKKWLVAQINASGDYRNFVARMEGMVASLSHVRAKDRMTSLISSGQVTKVYLDAWTKLRNRVVHPKEVDPQRIDAGEIQQILDLINKTTTLMYEIIFYLIGYAGVHADFGQVGFPARNYPVRIS
jgi:hypothetical protein